MDRICLVFINTGWYITHETHADPLRDPQQVRDLLDQWGLAPDPGLDVSPARMEQLISLRDLLSGAISALDSRAGIPPATLKSINEILARSPQHLEVRQDKEGFAAEWRPTHRDWDYVLYAITASFAELLFCHDPARIHRCGNADCGWVEQERHP